MTVANYSAELVNFVDDSNVILNNSVSSTKLQSVVNCFKVLVVMTGALMMCPLQAVHDMVQLVGSLLQWSPENIVTASSSRLDA